VNITEFPDIIIDVTEGNKSQHLEMISPSDVVNKDDELFIVDERFSEDLKQ
jgi:hypothetical protein